MKHGVRPLLVIAVLSTLGARDAAAVAAPAPTANAAAASQGDLVTTVAGEPPAPDGLKSVEGVLGVNPGAALVCPLRLHAGFATPGASPSTVYTFCNSDLKGNVLCITCCTCVFIGIEMDCQCATDCIQIF